jgi:hypothetical protein
VPAAAGAGCRWCWCWLPLVLILVTRGTLALTVDGQASELKAGTAGHIMSGTGYLLANPGRAETTFALVHIPPAQARARYTRTGPPAKPGSSSGPSPRTGRFRPRV